jgi:hypothetical protein
MIEIQEVEINLCDNNGLVYGDDATIFEERQKNAFQITRKKADYVRIGYEFCENELFYTKTEELLNKVKMAEKKKLRIVFVLPPLHERSLETYRNWIRNTLLQLPIEEFVVNDISTLYMLREELKWKGVIVFGRLFDKSIREIRTDLSELIDVEKHGSDIFLPNVMNKYFQKMSKEWGIYAFETDTIPDGVLNVEAWSSLYSVHVHYPRICLSKAAYCEYDRNMFRFDSGCGRACTEYGKRIGFDEKRIIYKEGLSVFGIQQKPISEVVTGNIRMIYSGGQAR